MSDDLRSHFQRTVLDSGRRVTASTLQRAHEKIGYMIQHRGDISFTVDEFRRMNTSLPIPPERREYVAKSGIVRLFQIDKRTGRVHKYELGVDSRAMDMLAREVGDQNRHLVDKNPGTKIATRPNRSPEEAWITQQVADGGGDAAHRGRVIWERFREMLRDDDPDRGNEIQDLWSGTVAFELVTDSVKEPAAEGAAKSFAVKSLRDARHVRFVPSDMLTYEMDPECTGLGGLIRRRTCAVERLSASCVPQAILSTFGATADKQRLEARHCRRAKGEPFDMAYVVRAALGREWDGSSEVQMTVAETADFLGSMGAGVRVYDVRNRVVFERTCDDGERRVRPGVLRLVYHDNHVEPMDRECTRPPRNVMPRPRETFAVTKRWTSLRQPELVDSTHDILERVRAAATARTGAPGTDDRGRLRLTYQGDMCDLARLLTHCGYTVETSVRSGADVTRIAMRRLVVPGGRTLDIVISATELARGVGTRFDGQAEYEAYATRDARFRAALLCQCNMSRLGPTATEVFDRYAVPVLVGRVAHVDETVDALDFCKFYTACLRDAPYLPVASPFWDFVEADDADEVDERTLYLVDTRGDDVVYGDARTLMYGTEALRVRAAGGVRVTVLAKMMIIARPNDVRGEIESLYRSELCEDHKKAIVNKAIGMCGKRWNEARTTTPFRNRDDAEAHRTAFGGSVVCVDMDSYLATNAKRTALVEGFRPIQAMVMGEARFKLFRLCRELREIGARVVGFKTDCVYFHRADWRRPEERGAIGGLKLLRCQDAPETYVRRNLGEALVPFLRRERRQCTIVEPEDENNAHAAMQPWTLALAPAGCGKTVAAMRYATDKFGAAGVLAVCAWNAQARRLRQEWHGVEAVTLHRLLGLGADDTYVGGDPVALGDVKCIVFDEVFLHRHCNLCRMMDFMARHGETVEVLATGDPRQLDAVDDVVGNDLKLEMIRGLFGRVLVLRVNKRLKSDVDRARLAAIERDVDDPSVETAWDLVALHFPRSQMIKTVADAEALGVRRALAYFNASCAALNRAMTAGREGGKILADGVTYVPGDVVLCRRRLAVGAIKMLPNFEYEVTGVTGGRVQLTDADDAKKEMEITEAEFVGHFALKTCATVHSTQGGRIAEAYLVADGRGKYTSKKWMYSAISRAADLGEVFFLEEKLWRARDVVSPEAMVEGYKQQDAARMKEEPSEEGYVTARWIRERFEAVQGRCRCCGEQMVFERRAANIVTVNRLNNALAHVKDNCELVCLSCNRTAH